MPQHRRVIAFAESEPGDKLHHGFIHRWPAYRRWYLQESDTARPDMDEAISQLRQYMPELLPVYEQLRALLPDDPLIARFLTLYNPPAFIAGWSQGVWPGPPAVLLRNYDFPARLWDAEVTMTGWNGTRVIGMSDCAWGLLDGINEHGLTGSLSFGGRSVRGDGFAVTLVLRYVLEFCSSVPEAVAVLRRVPINMAYNITLVDASGDCRTVMVSPDQGCQVIDLPYATNHQLSSHPQHMEFMPDSRTRAAFLSTRLSDPNETLPHLKALFMQPPLYRAVRDAQGWGTLYSACYCPLEGSAEFFWPGQSMSKSFDAFGDEELLIQFPGY
jgi:predicted choloylglycine hydrolase